MITTNLAELIHSGVGKYYTWNIGTTGSARLPVAKDCYIIITDFYFSNFVDRNPLDANFDIQEALKNCVHHLRFKSQSESYLYNIRTPFKIEQFEGVDFLMPIGESGVRFDTYQLHTTDVHIDIWRLQDFTNWILSSGKLANKTAEPAGPLGYGTVNLAPNQNVIRQVELGAGQYVPYGENQDIPLLDGWREQFFSDINNRTFLYPPAIDEADGNFTYPLVTIGYVLVKEPFNRKKK